jgi:hypothetical protein
MAGAIQRMAGAMALVAGLAAAGPARAEAEPEALTAGRTAVQSLAGCYLVDYSYVETEALAPGYTLDRRVYDVNRSKAVKEWIVATELSPTRLWVQHVLFMTGRDGRAVPGAMLKHTAEDWQFGASHYYDYAGGSTWNVAAVPADAPVWTRRITNLDDGLRYACAAPWLNEGGYATWACDSYAPIPGRETRDMGRHDYNALARTTRVISYGDSWLERQDNVKTVDDGQGGRTSLARETGKNWYVRLPDSACAEAATFMEKRQEFWDIVREAWDETLTFEGPFVERVPAGAPPRYVAMGAVERAYFAQSAEPMTHAQAKARVHAVIDAYRAR